MKEIILENPILFSLLINFTDATINVISINNDFYYGTISLILCYILNVKLISKLKELNKYYIFSLSAIFIISIFIILTFNKYIAYDYYKF